MKGHIVPRGKCPHCKHPFSETKKGYVCNRHKVPVKPDRFRILIQGEYIYSDKQGMAIDSYARAMQILIHINTEIEEGTFDISHYVRSARQKFLVNVLAPRLWEKKREKLAPSWAPDFKRILDRISAYFKNKDVREIKRLHIDDFVATLKEYSPKTQQNHLDVLTEFLRWVRDYPEMILRVPKIPPIPQETKIPPVLSKEQRDILVMKTPEGDRPIIRFICTYGCRPGEARALRVQDVDLQGGVSGVVLIHATFSDKEIRNRRKGIGAPPLELPIREEVRGYIEKRVKEALPLAPLFPNPRTGGFYLEPTFYKLKARIWKAAGLDNSIRFYDATRHSIATEAVSKGATLDDVRELYGHTDIRTTKRYAHANMNSKIRTLEVISGEKVVWIGPEQKTAKNG